ncbi:MAG: DUF305 domain-containing protein [Alkalinema sp. RU_4_3]|nr:DUF305 domain-containing protein [Alkalinema sp. RU_4_3]
MHSRSSRQRLSLSLASIALGLLSACGTSAQSPSAQSPSPSSPMHSGMQHDMGHSMDLGPADAEYDLRFIDAMVPHHEGAIAMATDLAQKSKRPELQKLAKTMIAAQTQEVVQMNQWRKSWYPEAPAKPIAWHSQMQHSMAMTNAQVQAMRMDRDLGPADADYDRRFLQAMVPHHEAAVVMARDLAQKTRRPELQKLAKDIIASQQIEIDQMKQWQGNWYKSN